jgi:hypothetical protein
MNPASLDLTRIGRWVEDNGGLYTPTTGYRLRWQFTGTACAVTCSGGLAVNLFIDEGLLGRQAPGTINVTVAAGSHTAELWVESVDYTNDRWAGWTGCTVTDITASNVQPWPTGLPKMLVLGDSISEGLRLLDVGTVQNLHDGRQVYHQQAGAALGLEIWTLCFGGTGILKAWGSLVPDALAQYPYKKTGVAAADPAFDYALIAHAANDIGLDDTAFESDYATLLGMIRTDHPGITIFCLTPIVGYANDKVQSVKDVVTAAVTAFLVDTRLWPEIARSPDGGHPSLAGHTTMATALVADIEAYLDAPAATVYLGSRSFNLSAAGTGPHLRGSRMLLVEPGAAGASGVRIQRGGAEKRLYEVTQ